MKLSQGEMGQTYRVLKIGIGEKTGRRLAALGLTDEARVTVLQERKNGSVIVRVRGTRLAVGQAIASQILVCRTVDLQHNGAD